MNKEKLFEVILAPTDMLERELEDVLGGNQCGSNYCKSNNGCCNINSCGGNEGAYCDINTCKANSCPPGFVLKGCDCVPAPEKG